MRFCENTEIRAQLPRMFPLPSVTISRSRDYALLNRIATSEKIYRATSDDGSPLPGRWRVAEREDCIYFLATKGEHILGFCAFYPLNAVTYESHLCFLSRGPVNELCYREMLSWMWANSKAQRIIGAIPEYNHLAIAFCKRIGFERFGWNRDSWLKDGKLYAQVWMGISRPLPTDSTMSARGHVEGRGAQVPASGPNGSTSEGSCV